MDEQKFAEVLGRAAVLFILANIVIGRLPCAAWVRYGVSALVIMGFGNVFYKKQFVLMTSAAHGHLPPGNRWLIKRNVYPLILERVWDKLYL